MPYLFGIIIVLSIFSGVTFMFISTGNTSQWEQLVPELTSPKGQISTIIVFDAMNYNFGLTVTLRSIQAIVNSQLPNQTALFIIQNPIDKDIALNIYAKAPHVALYAFPETGNQVLDTHSLLEYFKGIIRGYVLFNSWQKTYIPAVINFLSYYQNTIAVPDYMYNILPDNISLLEMFNFISFTNSTTKDNITNIYQNQISSFENNLAGVNIWKTDIDKANYFDFPIAQKYFSFPDFLLNGSFDSLQKTIENQITKNSHKPLLNNWPNKIIRLSVPLYSNISDITNLSFMTKPLLFNQSIQSTFQTVFAKQAATNLQVNLNKSTGIYYSIVTDYENDSINYFLNTILRLVFIDQTILNNITISIADSTIILLPDLMYWLFEEHPQIHVIPKISIGKIIEPLYFPEIFSNQTALVVGSSDKVIRNDWNESEYQRLLQNNLLGLFSGKDNHDIVFSGLPIKNIIETFKEGNNASELFFYNYFNNKISSTNESPFIISLEGNLDFIINLLINLRLAVKSVNSAITDTTIMNITPNQLFNLIK